MKHRVAEEQAGSRAEQEEEEIKADVEVSLVAIVTVYFSTWR